MVSSGLRAAYNALKAVCDDPKAPAPAKATAGVALLRAAGVFAKLPDEDDGDETDLTTLTAVQLERRVARIVKNGQRLEAELAALEVEDVAGGIFE